MIHTLKHFFNTFISSWHQSVSCQSNSISHQISFCCMPPSTAAFLSDKHLVVLISLSNGKTSSHGLPCQPPQIFPTSTRSGWGTPQVKDANSSTHNPWWPNKACAFWSRNNIAPPPLLSLAFLLLVPTYFSSYWSLVPHLTT